MRVMISPLVIIMLITLTMCSAILSVLLFTTNTYLYNQQQAAVLANKSGSHIISQIFVKLDALNHKSLSLIRAQGNISDTQRHRIIEEFENLPQSGFASHKDIQNLIGNISKHTANITLQKDNNLVAHEILNILKNGTH